MSGRIVVVTGTDTGVGKTVATAALATMAKSRGSVAVYKPVQTGTAVGDNDAAEIRRLSGVETAFAGAALSDPLAPVTAARREGVRLPTLADHVETVSKLAAAHDVVLVEGAGGVLVALTAAAEYLADLAAQVNADVVVVARPGLGTLNHTALTVEGLAARRCRTVGVVIGAWPATPDLAERCNVADLPDVTGVPTIGRIPEGVASLPASEFRRQAATWLDTAGWMT